MSNNDQFLSYLLARRRTEITRAESAVGTDELGRALTRISSWSALIRCWYRTPLDIPPAHRVAQFVYRATMLANTGQIQPRSIAKQATRKIYRCWVHSTYVPKCRGKRKFESRTLARLALAVISRRDRRASPDLEKRTYFCQRCQAWHLTRKPKRVSLAA